MKHFPIFLNIVGQKVVISGDGEAAVAKLRLLLKTEAQLMVYGTCPNAEILKWAHNDLLIYVDRPIIQQDLDGAALCYGADEDPILDAAVLNLAKNAGVLVNIVDNLQDSQFITPAIVDRDPVTVAIGTEGAAPVLARQIKSKIEEQLPPSLGTLARIGQSFRTAAEILPTGRIRRGFWSDYYFNRGPKALAAGSEADVKDSLDTLLNETLNTVAQIGHVSLIGAGPGDPELLTLKARKNLHDADVVIHDRLVSTEILELARRESIIIEAGKQGFGPSMDQSDINALMVEYASQGYTVARLKGGDPTVFGRLDEEMDALDTAGISFDVVPGITAASAAAANIKVSLTRRGRNSSLRILTGHDIKGFADHDWRDLAQAGTTAAIYMGKRASRFLQGRLMMHGASADTALTIVENATRADQKILSTTLMSLPDLLAQEQVDGPAIILLGLSPRLALQTVTDLDQILEGAV